MVSQTIMRLLEDAFASSCLTHASVVLGEIANKPHLIAGQQVPSKPSRKIASFRNELLSGSVANWPRSLNGLSNIDVAYTGTGFEGYLFASSLEIPPRAVYMGTQ